MSLQTLFSRRWSVESEETWPNSVGGLVAGSKIVHMHDAAVVYGK